MTLTAFAVLAGILLGLAVALWLGPLLLTARAVLSWVLPPAGKRRWQTATALGLSSGMMAAVALAGAFLGLREALVAVIFGLLLLLAIMDLRWRWLPLEWTVTLGLAGLGIASIGARLTEAILTALATMILLRGLQIGFRKLRGTEGMGTGDVFLASALGILAGPVGIALTLGLASVTGLTNEALRRGLSGLETRPRFGVAFGAHLAGVFALLWIFKPF